VRWVAEPPIVNLRGLAHPGIRAQNSLLDRPPVTAGFAVISDTKERT